MSVLRADTALSFDPLPRQKLKAAGLVFVFAVVFGLVVGLAQARLLPSFSADDPGSLLWSAG